MLAIEPSHGVRAAGRDGSIRRSEPEPEVERVDRLRRRVLVRVRERRLIMHDGGRLVPRGLRDDERLDVEASPESLVPFAVLVSLDVALIPGQTERGRGQLKHEEIEFRVRRQPRDVYVHPLYRAERSHPYVRRRVGHTPGRSGGDHHFEVSSRLLLFWFGQRRASSRESRENERPYDDAQPLRPLCRLHDLLSFFGRCDGVAAGRPVTNGSGESFGQRPGLTQRLERRNFRGSNSYP